MRHNELETLFGSYPWVIGNPVNPLFPRAIGIGVDESISNYIETVLKFQSVGTFGVDDEDLLWNVFLNGTRLMRDCLGNDFLLIPNSILHAPLYSDLNMIGDFSWFEDRLEGCAVYPKLLAGNKVLISWEYAPTEEDFYSYVLYERVSDGGGGWIDTEVAEVSNRETLNVVLMDQTEGSHNFALCYKDIAGNVKEINVGEVKTATVVSLPSPPTLNTNQIGNKAEGASWKHAISIIEPAVTTGIVGYLISWNQFPGAENLPYAEVQIPLSRFYLRSSVQEFPTFVIDIWEGEFEIAVSSVTSVGIISRPAKVRFRYVYDSDLGVLRYNASDLATVRNLYAESASAGDIVVTAISKDLSATQEVSFYRDGVYIGNAEYAMSGTYEFTDEGSGLVDGTTYAYTVKIREEIVSGVFAHGDESHSVEGLCDKTAPDGDQVIALEVMV